MFSLFTDYFANGSNAYKKATFYSHYDSDSEHWLKLATFQNFSKFAQLVICTIVAGTFRTTMNSLQQFGVVPYILNAIHFANNSYCRSFSTLVRTITLLRGSRSNPPRSLRFVLSSDSRIILNTEHLLGSQREAATVLGHLFVVMVWNSRLVEIEHQIMQLLGASDQRTERKFVVRPFGLDLPDLISVVTIKHRLRGLVRVRRKWVRKKRPLTE